MDSQTLTLVTRSNLSGELPSDSAGILTDWIGSCVALIGVEKSQCDCRYCPPVHLIYPPSVPTLDSFAAKNARRHRPYHLLTQLARQTPVTLGK